MTCCLKTCLCLSLSLFPCWPTWCWSSPSWPTWMLAGTDTTPCHRAAPGPPPCDTWTSPGRHSQPSPPVYPKLWRYKSGSSSSNPDRPDTIKQKTLTDNPLLPHSLSCTGVGSEQQWSQKLISGPACLERNPPLWEQASEASLWIAVPQSANTHNTGKNELIITFHPLILFVFPGVTLLVLPQSNTLNMFSHSDLQSYQRLQSLQAGQNKFVCSCDFVDFFQSVMKGSGDVHLTDGEETYICDSPLFLQGEELGQVHRSIVECHQVLFVSVSCGVVLFVVILLSVLLWRLHAIWYLKMTWAWLNAKRNSRQRRCKDRDSEALLSFDAFVSYSERDASWVENFLVPELEEPRLRPNFLSCYLF